MDLVYLALSILLFIKTNVWFVFNANKGKVLQFFTWIEKVPSYWRGEIFLAGGSIFPQNFKDFWKTFITRSYSSLLLSSITALQSLLFWDLYFLPDYNRVAIVYRFTALRAPRMDFFPTLHQPILHSLSYISFCCLPVLHLHSWCFQLSCIHIRWSSAVGQKHLINLWLLDILFYSLQPQLYCLLFI